MLVSIGKTRFDLFADGAFASRVMRETAHVTLARDQGLLGALALSKAIAWKPQLWWGILRNVTRMAWQARTEWRSPRIRKLSFFTHSFMDACDLDAERVEACVFMAATVEGPMSMCVYNAQRDSYLLKPIRLASGETWQPLAVKPDANGEIRIPLKLLKGKPREAAIAAHRDRARCETGQELVEALERTSS